MIGSKGKESTMRSWKTTLAGILLVAGAVCTQVYYLLDSDPKTLFDFQVILTALAGAGFIFARDSNVTSEQAGAKKPDDTEK